MNKDDDENNIYVVVLLFVIRSVNIVVWLSWALKTDPELKIIMVTPG